MGEGSCYYTQKDQVIFQQRPEGSERASQVDIWEKSIPVRRNSISAKTLRQEKLLDKLDGE